MKSFFKFIGFIILTILGIELIKSKINDPKRKEKAIAKAKIKLYKKLNKDDEKRKKIKDKYRTPVGMILILIFLCSQVQGEYIKLDKQDGKYYDYGHQTNYIKALEDDIDFLVKARTNTIELVTNIISNTIDENKPSFFQRNGFCIGGSFGAIGGFFIGWIIKGLVLP